MKLLSFIFVALFSLQISAHTGGFSVGASYGLPFPADTDAFRGAVEEDFSLNGRLRYNFSHALGAQLSYGHFEMEDIAGAFVGQRVITLDAIYNMFPASSPFHTYLTLGAGAAQTRHMGLDSWDPTLKAGVGVEYFLTHMISLGLNLDYHYTFNTDPAMFGGITEEYHVFNPNVGVNFAFGTAPAVAAAAAAPIVKEVVKTSGDSDGDGVADGSDQCPNTPAGESVNASGCSASQIDSDNDGVYDSLDKCPGTEAGAKVNSAGCKENEAVSISLNVNFATNSSTVESQYHSELQRVADFLNTYKDTRAEIEGHTDSQGARSYNISLSQRRADAVKAYLVNNHGVDGSRLSAVGYGPDRPIADNATSEGRRENRRVVATFTSR